MAAKKAARSKSQASKPAGKKAAAVPSAASRAKTSKGKEEKPTNRKNTLAWKSRLKAEYAVYESLQERRKVVQQAIRGVYAYLIDMVHSNIDLAGEGNYSAAKFLMEFAGVDELAALILANAETTPAAQPPTPHATEVAVEDDDDPTKAVLSFYKKLGMTPPRLKPPKPVEAAEQEDAAPAVV
jgi:hypothetical protein